MVIDYQKLNEMAISDEFPLPKQEDILQALEGSQWLSTLDALAGFTQLEVKPKDRGEISLLNSPRLVAICQNALRLQEWTKHFPASHAERSGSIPLNICIGLH